MGRYSNSAGQAAPASLFNLCFSDTRDWHLHLCSLFCVLFPVRGGCNPVRYLPWQFLPSTPETYPTRRSSQMQLKLGVNLGSNFTSDDVDIEARAAARRILSTPSSHLLPTRRGVRSAIHLVLIRLAGASGTRLSDTQRYRVYPPSKPDYSSPSPSANPIRLCPCSAPPSRNLMQMSVALRWGYDSYAPGSAF